MAKVGESITVYDVINAMFLNSIKHFKTLESIKTVKEQRESINQKTNDMQHQKIGKK